MPKKNRLFTDFCREIRNTRSRFLSLLLLSALAVAFLAGLRTTAPDMKYTADAYFDRLHLMDVRVLSTLGLTDEDVAVLARQPGIAAAEGAYTIDALVHTAGSDLIIKAHSLSPQGINAPELLTGRMPANSRECLADPELLKLGGFSLGARLTLDTGTGDFEDALADTSYTIVGTANSPLYISIERGSSSLGTGRVSAFLLLPPEAFTMDTYTDAYLMADDTAPLLCYSDPYEDRIDALVDTLEPLSDTRAALRYSSVVDEANEKLDDAQQKFDDAARDADQELADAAQELTDARKELDDGWRDYHDGLAELRDGRETLAREKADAEQKIADAEAELPDAKQELDDGEIDYADGLQTWLDGKQDYDEGVAELADGQEKYDDGRQTLLEGEDAYNENLLVLQDGEAEYARNKKNYNAGLAELEDGSALLMESKVVLSDAARRLQQGDAASAQGEAELAAAQAQLTAGQQQIDGAAGMIAGMAGVSGDPAQWSDADKMKVDGTVKGAKAQLDLALQDPSLPPEQKAALQAQSDALGGLLQQTGGQPGSYLQTQKNTINQGWSAYHDGLAALNAGAGELSAGWQQYIAGFGAYSDARRAFDSGVDELQAGSAEFTAARLALDDGAAQLKDGRKTLDDGWAELDDAKQALVDGQQELDDAARELADGKQELDDARRELDDGWQKYHDGVAELADAKARLPREIADAEQTLRDGETELDDALRALRDGEADYADGLVEYEDGKREADEKLSDARQKLNDARRKIAEINDSKWYVLGRGTNMGYVAFQQDAERMGNLASVFPLIFFLVAALVCLTTMTRMVEEQRVQIGSLKALGYGKLAIAFKYVGYGLLASLLGGLAGLALGCTLIPFIIFNAWKILYQVGSLLIPAAPGIMLFSVCAAVFCVTGTAIVASFATLTAVPAALMRPKAPPIGKRVLLERIKPLWKRLSFTKKVTVRNLFRYQKRFWMTVIGIGGCTALIITGFGLRDSIFDILGLQYDAISTYSANIGLDDGITPDEELELSRALDASALVTDWMPCHQISLTAESPARTMDAYLFAVSDPVRLGDFVHLRHRLDHAPVVLPAEGAVITEKLADMLKLGVGDTLTLSGDTRVQVTIADITENYVFHYIYLSAAYYEQLYGAPPATNLILADYAPDTKENADQVAASLVSLSGVTAVSRIRDTRDTLTKSMESVDYAVIVVIFSAAALAFVVLYNLTNINVTERLRELATLKVLGFYDRELSAYVYRENILLTCFGVLLGLVLGKFLHRWLVLTVEIDMVMFGRAARPESYLFAVLLTLLFSALVNLAAHWRLKKIDMVESLKTVE